MFSHLGHSGTVAAVLASPKRYEESKTTNETALAHRSEETGGVTVVTTSSRYPKSSACCGSQRLVFVVENSPDFFSISDLSAGTLSRRCRGMVWSYWLELS